MHNSQNLSHCAGLVFGYVFHEGRAAAATDETLSDAVSGEHDFVWLHLALSDHRARRFLETFAILPDEARALMLTAEDRIQFHLTPEGGFGVLPDIEQDFHEASLDAARLSFWLDRRHLVTVRRHPARAVDDVRHEVGRGLTPATPAATLIRLGEHYVEIAEARLAALSRELGRVEDAVLADREGLDQMKLGPVRRELSRYSREFGSLRSALARALSARRGVVESPLAELLPGLLQDAEDFDRDAGALADRARLLYEEINTRIAAVTNRSLSALTVISTLLLPPTFVAGAFGMNVEGIPWAHDPEGFAIVLGVCLVLVGLGWFVLRRFRILP